MAAFLLAICILLSIALITVVALQTTKSEGLSGTIGGAYSSSFKGKGIDETLARWTRYIGVMWIIAHLLYAITYTHS